MTPNVVVIGAGGHAKVCVELLRAMGRSIAVCVGGHESSDFCLDVPVLHGDEHLIRLRAEGHTTAFVAIGANALRQHLAKLAIAHGYELINAISPTAVVSPTARLGKGIAIMAGVVVNADTFIADFAIINTSASVDHDGRIGEAAHIAPQCGIAGEVTVGARAFLGIGCKVIPGVSIGHDVVAGAGSIIISDVAPNSKVAGIPARKLNEKGRQI
jgi:UDP-perosamine 4-acetyltransferase